MKKEIRRQFIHYFFGCLVIILIGVIGAIHYALACVGIISIGLSFSLIIKKGRKIPLFSKVIDYAGRKDEKKFPGRGAIIFFLATLIASVLFYQNPLILLGALIVLVFGDSVATVIGVTLGKTKLMNNRSLEGTIAGILVSFFYLQIMFPPGAALIAAIIGMGMEFVPINDNLTIPIAAGLVLMLLI
ncbi:MAG: hypothetical protein ABIE23_00740 [archaeon]